MCDVIWFAVHAAGCIVIRRQHLATRFPVLSPRRCIQILQRLQRHRLRSVAIGLDVKRMCAKGDCVVPVEHESHLSNEQEANRVFESPLNSKAPVRVATWSGLPQPQKEQGCMNVVLQFLGPYLRIQSNSPGMKPQRLLAAATAFLFLPGDKKRRCAPPRLFCSGPIGLQHGRPAAADQRRRPSPPHGAAEQQHRPDLLRSRVRERELVVPGFGCLLHARTLTV